MTTHKFSNVPLTRSIKVDRVQLLALHARDPERYPALLESAAANPLLARFDILFAYPQQTITLHGDGRITGSTDSDFLEALDAAWRTHTAASVSSQLPFKGGWSLYFSYDFARFLEPRLRAFNQSREVIAQAARIPAAIVRDASSGEAWIVVEADFHDLLPQIEADLANLPAALAGDAVVTDLHEENPEQFLHAVERAKEYIRAGDIYQANLSRGWHGVINGPHASASIYAQLRRTNPAPFAAIARCGDRDVVSSSPERLVSVKDGVISTRPIAGTRPRAADPALDAALVEELRAHPKERAEHIMLIDLERNDLGRLCVAGSVVVDEYMTIETYAHVHHIVSNVSGRLRDDVTPGAVIRATFPGGTITGCPKIRCMEIIAELEGVSRGAYTGSLGYLNHDGSMDLNILIRTFEIREEQLTFRAGAGIVADSVPERELEETRAKARGLLRALQTSVD